MRGRIASALGLVLGLVVGVGACGGTEPGGTPDAGQCNGTPGTSIARCGTGTPNYQQCLEFTGSFWNASNADTACIEDFSTATPTCPTASAVGRCLRNCGRADETVETFYSNGPTTFNAPIAQAVCNAYVASDAVAPIWIP